MSTPGTVKTKEEIELWIVQYLAKTMKIDPDNVPVDEDFSQLNVDSSLALSMTADLEDFVGRRLSASLAYNYPTIEKLAERLAKGK